MSSVAEDLKVSSLGLVPVLEIEGAGVALFANRVAERPQKPRIACYALLWAGPLKRWVSRLRDGKIREEVEHILV